MKRTGELSFLPEKTCAICYKDTNASDADPSGSSRTGPTSTDITNPYEAAPCGHLYCYICITSKISLEEGDGWECLRCSTLIKKCRPWKGSLGGPLGDWGEDEARPMSSGKKVGFNDTRGRRRSRSRSRSQSTSPSLDDDVKEYYYHDHPEPTEESSKLTETIGYSPNTTLRSRSPSRSRTPSPAFDKPGHDDDEVNNGGNLDGSYTYIPEHDSQEEEDDQEEEVIEDDDSQGTERPYQRRWDGISYSEEEDENYHREEVEQEEEERESVYDTAGEEEEMSRRR